MSKGSLGTALIIISIFILLNASLSLLIGISKIKNNWEKYKCNPGIMPFAQIFGHDPIENAKECVEIIQMDFMSVFLAPFYSAIQYFISGSAVFVNLFEKLKSFSNIGSFDITQLSEKIKERFNSIMTGVNTTFIKINDLFNNTTSMITIIFYMLITIKNTTVAAWNDMPGSVIKIVRSLNSQ